MSGDLGVWCFCKTCWFRGNAGEEGGETKREEYELLFWGVRGSGFVEPAVASVDSCNVFGRDQEIILQGWESILLAEWCEFGKEIVGVWGTIWFHFTLKRSQGKRMHKFHTEGIDWGYMDLTSETSLFQSRAVFLGCFLKDINECVREWCYSLLERSDSKSMTDESWYWTFIIIFSSKLVIAASWESTKAS